MRTWWLLHRQACRVFWPLLALKFFLLTYVCVIYFFFPQTFNIGNYKVNPHWPDKKNPELAERFSTWDSQHYMHLSEVGFEKGSLSAAFYPLWPAVIHVITPLFAWNILLASLVAANIFSLLGWVLFHRLVAADYGEEHADLATLLMVASPGSLFYLLPYSESLFFFLTMTFFWGLRRQNASVEILSSLFLPLTRAVGVFMCVPSAVHYYLKCGPWRRMFLSVAAILIGWAVYFLIMKVYTGNALEGFDAQKRYICKASIMKVFDVIGFVKAFFAANQFQDYLKGYTDRIFFLIFLSTLIPLFKMNKVYFAFAIMIGLVPAMTQSFMSYTRFFPGVFPVFIVLAKVLSDLKRPNITALVAASFFSLQLVSLFRQANNHWVG